MSLRFAVMLLIVPILMIVALRKPLWGVYSTMLLYYFRPGVWQQPSWWQPVYWITLCTIAGWAMKARDIRITPSLVVSGLLLLGMLVSSATARVSPDASYDTTVIILKLVIVQFLVIQLFRHLKDVEYFLWANILFNLWTLKSVVIITLGSGDAARANVSAAQGGGSNYLAMTFVMALPLLYFRFLYGKKWEKRFAIALTPLLLLAITGTGSRGGVLTLAMIFFFLVVRSRRVMLGAGTALLFVAMFVAITPEAKWERYKTIFAGKEDRGFAAQSRIELWKAGWTMFKESPITGVGHDNFQILSPRYTGFFAGDTPRPYDPALEGVKGYTGFVCHNTFIQALAEGGLIGAIPFFLLFVMYFVNCYSVRRIHLPEELRLRVWITSQVMEASMWAFIIASVFGSHFKIDFLWWYFGASTALVLVVKDLARRRQPAVGPSAVRTRPWASSSPSLES